MAQRPSFDITKLSTAAKILLGAGALYFIDLFLAWNRKCFEGSCGTLTGWHGLGILCGILVIALLAWEGMIIAQVKVNLGTVRAGLVSAALAGAILLFTILRVLIKPSYFIIGSIPVFVFGWIGLVLALVIAYGGYMRYVEPAPSAVSPPPPPPPAPGTGGLTP